MKKNNNVVISLLIIIIVILIGLCILFATGIISLNFNNNNISENFISKIDINKVWVYDANYKLSTNKESYYGYTDHTKLISSSDLIVPYLNIDSEEAMQTNKEIYKLYESLINTFNENLKDEIGFTIVSYKTYTNKNILSVVITTETAGTDVSIYDYYTYNFNLETGKLLSYNEVYKIVGLNENNITDKATQALTNELRKNYSGDDFNLYNINSINNYKNSVSNNTIKYFINEENKLNIIVTLEMPFGRGQFDTVITVE